MPAAASAALSNFIWSGRGSSNYPFWSVAANWSGHAVPKGSVGELMFPRLGGGCSPTSSPKTCYSARNDLTGLSAQAISIDDAEGYSLSGNPVTLGAGGLTAAPQTSHCPCGPTLLGFPIVLSASQTWTIDGGAIGFAFVSLPGPVTGSSHALHLIVKNGADPNVGNIEVGPLSVTRPRSRNPLDVFNNGILLPPFGGAPSLNGSDGQPVRLSNVSLASSRGVVGPLTVARGVLWDAGFQPAGSLTVRGALSLNSTSEVLVYVTHGGSTAGADYWQIKAGGQVSLGGSHLILSTSNSKGYGPNQPCPKVSRGEVETLITTAGSIQGRFHRIRNGAKIPITCRAKTQPKVKIFYSAHAVKAVVQ